MALLMLPLAYTVMFFYRVGQCYYLNIPIEFAPVTADDFLTYLVPAFLFIVPCMLIVSATRAIKRQMSLLAILPIIGVSLIYAVLSNPASLDEKPYLALIAVSFAIYFLVLVVMVAIDEYRIRFNGKEGPASVIPRTCKSAACYQLLMALFFFLLLAFAHMNYVTLLLFFVISVYVLALRSSAGNKSGEKHMRDNLAVNTSIEIESYAALFALCLLFALMIGYAKTAYQPEYPVLEMNPESMQTLKADESLWCILIMRPDCTAICIPAHEMGGEGYSAQVSDTMDVRLIDTSITPCTITPGKCALRNT